MAIEKRVAERKLTSEGMDPHAVSEIREQMERAQVEPNAAAYNVMIDSLGRAGRVDDAHALLTLLLTLTTPGLLLAHAFLVTHELDPTLRILAMAAPIGAVLLGSLLGAMFGAAANGAASAMRTLALPLELAAFALTIFATLASLRILLAAAQNGGVIVTP